MTTDNDSTFPDLASAVREIERLQDEVKLANGVAREILESKVGQISQLGDTIDRLRAELESHAWEVSPGMAQAKIDELNRDNARLAAALKRCEFGAYSYIDDRWYCPVCSGSRPNHVKGCALKDNTSLRDLLAPFLDSVERVHSYDGKDGRREWVSRGDWLHPGECLAIVSEVELARLQAMMEKKA